MESFLWGRMELHAFHLSVGCVCHICNPLQYPLLICLCTQLSPELSVLYSQSSISRVRVFCWWRARFSSIPGTAEKIEKSVRQTHRQSLHKEKGVPLFVTTQAHRVIITLTCQTDLEVWLIASSLACCLSLSPTAA